jgi:hypothetical protein
MNMAIMGDKILEAIRAALKGRGSGEEGATVQELAEASDQSVIKVRVALRALIASGQVVAGRGLRPAIDGRLNHVPVYRQVTPAKHGKRR